MSALRILQQIGASDIKLAPTRLTVTKSISAAAECAIQNFKIEKLLRMRLQASANHFGA